MSNSVNAKTEKIEQQIASMLSRRHCILTGRGASALYVAYHVVPDKKGRIIMPAMLCGSPAYTAIAAGHMVEFCDINEDTLQMDVSDLERILVKHNDIVAIVVVHLFGRASPIEEIHSLASEYNIPIIEDAAQAFGGSYRGKLLGGFGEASILSFGHTKPIDIGWGGALLTDDDAMASRFREMEKLLPEVPVDIDKRFEDYRKSYYIFNKKNNNLSRKKEYYKFLRKFHDIYIFRFKDSWCKLLESGLSELDSIVSKRQENEKLYYDTLKNVKEIKLLPVDKESVPWRFTVLLPENFQQKVTEQLRNSGWDASNWYPSLADYFENNESCKTATRIESQVLNLWLDPGKTTQYINGVCESLIEALAKR